MSKYIDKYKVLEYIIFGVVGKDITCGELTRAIESLPTIEVSEDMVSCKDFEDAIRRMEERNCLTCGMYHEGEWTLMARNPEKVTAEELDKNDRAVSLAEVCKIIQDTYEVCPATWGRLRNLPSVIPKPKEGEWVESPYEDADGMPAYRCSECGCLCGGGLNYCFKCGAKMRDDNVETD